MYSRWKKTKPRAPERWRGIHGDNICLKLFWIDLIIVQRQADYPVKGKNHSSDSLIIRCAHVYWCEYFFSVFFCRGLPERDIKITFIIILLLLCVFYKSGARNDTCWYRGVWYLSSGLCAIIIIVFDSIFQGVIIYPAPWLYICSGSAGRLFSNVNCPVKKLW